MIGLLGLVLLCPAQADESCIEPVGTQVQVTLYLGRDKPGGGHVGRRAWRRFQREEVVPRLPGYTTFRTRGVWTQDGELVRERSFVLQWIGHADAQAPLADVASAYRQRFDQSAVLLVEHEVETSFVIACEAGP